MNYAPYPTYKDSGIPWLEQVPEGWETSRVDFQCTVKARLGWKGLTASEYVDEGYVFLATPNIKGTEIDFENVNYINEQRYLESPEIMIEPGDVLLAKDGSTLGTTNYVRSLPRPATVNSSIAIVRPRKKNVEGAFLYRWFEAELIQSKIQQMKDGQGVPHLFQSDIRKFPLPLPSTEEQIAIARFLDEKTAEIDDLVAKKEELLRLLAEQRTALIAHAVTRGLNPTAPMKSSGIDWLGNVPEGWEVKPFKREVWYQEGPGIMAVDFRDEGVPLLRIRNLKPGKVELEGCNFLDPDMANGKWVHFQTEEGDRLISTSASTGLVSVVDKDSVGAIPYTGIIRIRPLNDSLLPEFLEYFVSSELFFDQIDLLATGTTIQHFGPYHLNQMVIAIPSIQEQGQLVEMLASDLSKISETRGMVEAALDRLKDYRSALITNAVTGKIKVA